MIYRWCLFKPGEYLRLNHYFGNRREDDSHKQGLCGIQGFFLCPSRSKYAKPKAGKQPKEPGRIVNVNDYTPDLRMEKCQEARGQLQLREPPLQVPSAAKCTTTQAAVQGPGERPAYGHLQGAYLLLLPLWDTVMSTLSRKVRNNPCKSVLQDPDHPSSIPPKDLPNSQDSSNYLSQDQPHSLPRTFPALGKIWTTLFQISTPRRSCRLLMQSIGDDFKDFNFGKSQTSKK